ncbi:peroxidase [Croceicoccus ponticola]|uniref:Peroxidase n=1 Tax=Croceicoccus ponticola TaxID=2217664 RepID=A0A437GUL0_9SPHN|nr:peroxidase-related enzyme [Croceicoccus ponticola]RVQ65164.1 peroxidase [Croceicoccus ponticola]
MPFLTYLKGDGLGEVLDRERERYAGFMLMGQQIMIEDAELSTVDRELIAAYVSALNDCSFCHGTHEAIARAFGADPVVLATMIADPASDKIPPKLSALLVYAKKLTETPSRLTQADADRVLAGGWSEQALSDLVAVVAYFAMANRLADGHGIEALDKAGNQAVANFVKDNGYPMIERIMAPIGKQSV